MRIALIAVIVSLGIALSGCSAPQKRGHRRGPNQSKVKNGGKKDKRIKTRSKPSGGTKSTSPAHPPKGDPEPPPDTPAPHEEHSHDHEHPNGSGSDHHHHPHPHPHLPGQDGHHHPY